MDAILTLWAEMGGLATLGPLAVAMMAAGVIAGLLAGFLGVGGGIILVPILYYAFSVLGIDEAVRMHMAVGTSLATIIPTSIRSLRNHHAKGAVDIPILKAWALPVIAGVLIGSVAANAMSGMTLTLIFGSIALCVAGYLGFAPDHWRLGTVMPGHPLNDVIGGLIGFFSTLIGIGGGTFGVSVMTLYGQPIHQAIGTSSGLGLLISIPGALGFIWAGWAEAGRPPLSIGYVNLAAWVFIIPLTLLAVPYGVRFAHSLDRTLLRRAFAAFLAVNASIMLIKALG